MVELKVKVGEKGQILIPKILRERYGIEEGKNVMIEPTEEGVLIRGRPSPQEIMSRLNNHVEYLKRLKVSGPRLGELKKTYLEIEFEEKTG
ncbi:MAG: AbrB/MazE/SpoVT family DNA-binding domain-containing protein [Crenarchaeota archaeon]|nr:AbrB/MazE/SpoVT family DNA-binding domain-containing protein [Thermoproteota archaeon]MDW8033742.1 AbrB/MazE/SpoVT family DNA-binding domain-containing protein [Nitrososphaerota archaeon]